MYLGFMNLHPVTFPIGNELVHAIGNVYNNALAVYLGAIKPEILEIIEVIELL